MATLSELQRELWRLESTGFRAKLDAHALAHGLKPTFVYAIASRETNCVNELGDYVDGEAHGVGIMQIDIQHQIALEARDSGSWSTDPDPLIEFGVALLRYNWQRAHNELAPLTPRDHLKVAASGYNCGISRAISSVLNGDDSDTHTTGRDYGADVMARMAMFDRLLEA